MYKKALYLFFLISTASFSSGMEKTPNLQTTPSFSLGFETPPPLQTTPSFSSGRGTKPFFKRREDAQKINPSTDDQKPGLHHKLKTPEPTPLLTLVAQKKFEAPVPKTLFEKNTEKLKKHAIAIEKAIEFIINFFEKIRKEENSKMAAIADNRLFIIDTDYNLIALKGYTRNVRFAVDNFLSIDIRNYHNFVEKVNALETLDDSYCGEAWILKNTIIDYVLSLDWPLQENIPESFSYFIKKEDPILKKEEVEDFMRNANDLNEHLNAFAVNFRNNVIDIIFNKKDKDNLFFKKILDDYAQYVMQFLDVHSNVEKIKKYFESVQFVNLLYFKVLTNDDSNNLLFDVRKIKEDMKFYTFFNKERNEIMISREVNECKKFFNHLFLILDKINKITNKLLEIKEEKDRQEKNSFSPYFVELFLKEVESGIFSEVDEIVKSTDEVLIRIKHTFDIYHSYPLLKSKQMKNLFSSMALFYQFFSDSIFNLKKISIYNSHSCLLSKKSLLKFFKKDENEPIYKSKFLNAFYFGLDQNFTFILEYAQNIQCNIEMHQKNFKNFQLYFYALENEINNISEEDYLKLKDFSLTQEKQEVYGLIDQKMIPKKK